MPEDIAKHLALGDPDPTDLDLLCRRASPDGDELLLVDRQDQPAMLFTGIGALSDDLAHGYVLDPRLLVERIDLAVGGELFDLDPNADLADLAQFFGREGRERFLFLQIDRRFVARAVRGALLEREVSDVRAGWGRRRRGARKP